MGIIYPSQPKTSDGKPIFSLWPTEGTRKTFVTPNWCDRCTWYPNAVRVVDEVASTSDFTSYSVVNNSLIDSKHGRLSGEEFLTDSNGYPFFVVVSVNDVAVAEQDPNTESGGDYTVNYEDGVIVFFTPRDPGDVVKVTYHYATTSMYILAPQAGKNIKIKSAEVQFSKNIDLTDSVYFQAYGYVIVFAPQLAQSNGGPYPDTTKIPLGNPTIYKTMMDYINEANGAHPEIPALPGQGGWRNLANGIITFPWNYQALTTISSAAGMEIRIFLKNEIPFGGSAATATFYCLSEDETNG